MAGGVLNRQWGARWLLYAVALGVAVPVWAASPAAAPAEIEAPASVEVYQGPRVLQSKNPSYPRAEQLAGGEGWVVMQFMVNAAGEPYEISVVDSVGSKSFGREAVAALERFQFEPARANGEPIDAGYHQKIVFSLQGGPVGASKIFVKRFKALNKAIAQSDQTRADALFAKLKVTNLYEDAFFNYLRARYYAQWGTPAQQLGALRRAVAHEESAEYLPAVHYLNALQRRFALELQLNDFAAAQRTASVLQKVEKDADRLAKIRSAIEELAKLRAGSTRYAVAGQLGDRTSWWLDLFRNTFQVQVAQGRIAELKLRCRKGYVFFRHDPELEYSVPQDHMPCGLEIVGDPGSEFSVVQ